MKRIVHGDNTLSQINEGRFHQQPAPPSGWSFNGACLSRKQFLNLNQPRTATPAFMGLKIFINTERKVSKKQEKDSFFPPLKACGVCASTFTPDSQLHRSQPPRLRPTRQSRRSA